MRSIPDIEIGYACIERINIHLVFQLWYFPALGGVLIAMSGHRVDSRKIHATTNSDDATASARGSPTLPLQQQRQYR